MTTPTGTIKFSDIQAEFGTSTNNSFGAYRVNQTVGDRSWPLDAGVPTSGPIKFSDLRGKTCNVVVDYTGSDIISDGISSASVNNLVTHVFDDENNTTPEGGLTISPSSGITVTPENQEDGPIYSTSTVSVNFTVSREASATSTITLTATVPDIEVITFSMGSDGTESQAKNIVPLLVYRVTFSGENTTVKIMDSGSDRNDRGRTLALEDEGGTDYNDLVVTTPGNDAVKGIDNTGGTFYKGSDELFYYVYFPSTFINTDDRKHYLISFSDGTTIPEGDTNVSTIQVTPNLLLDTPTAGQEGMLTGSGELKTIYVSLKKRVNSTSFEVWFYADIDTRNPLISNGQTFCRSFTISRSVSTSTTALGTAKDVYTASGVVIGGFRTKSSLNSGSNTTKKVHHLIRRKIGGGFQSGSWESGTQLNFIVTSSGKIYGRGGHGGEGGRQDQDSEYVTGTPAFGGRGGDALTLSYNANVVVESGGEIRGGGGGGGGGGYSYVGGESDTRSAGGGGGGGQGYPGGPGGAGGPLPAPSGYGGRNSTGFPGIDGSQTSPGQGGAGGGPDNWLPKTGGSGGSWGSAGNDGPDGSNTGGDKGEAGLAISKGSGVTVSLDNQGTISGNT